MIKIEINWISLYFGTETSLFFSSEDFVFCGILKTLSFYKLTEKLPVAIVRFFHSREVF